jgi:hypothetical protein
MPSKHRCFPALKFPLKKSSSAFNGPNQRLNLSKPVWKSAICLQLGGRSLNSLRCILGLVLGATLFEVNNVKLTLIVLSDADIKGRTSIFSL